MRFIFINKYRAICIDISTSNISSSTEKENFLSYIEIPENVSFIK